MRQRDLVFLAFSTAMEYHAAIPAITERWRAALEQHTYLCRCRRLPGEGRNLPRRARHALPRQRGRGQFHPGAAGSDDRAHRGGFRDGCRRRLDCGTRRQGRYRHHIGYSAGEPLREGRRRGDRAERQTVHGSINRHDARGPQFDDRSALFGRGHRRSQRRSRRATARRSCRRSIRPSAVSSAGARPSPPRKQG